MEYISSKNICLLVRETLKLLDKRPMEAGLRTSYIVYKMLAKTELFEEFEMAELCFVAALRDIGAYKTDKIDNMMKPGFHNHMPHSLYGFLFMKHLFPVPAYGKILLYHHMDFEQMKGVSYEFEFMSDYIHLADDINERLLKEPDTFDYHTLEADTGSKYEERTFRLFAEAEAEYGILEKLKGTSWKEELSDLMDYIMFRNDEKKQYLQMLMYCIGFRSQARVVDTVAAVCIAQEIGRKMKLKEESLEILYYGAILHDMGMLGLAAKEQNITYPPDKKSVDLIWRHINIAEELLRKRFTKQQVVDVALRHHERLDGSGYPNGLKAEQMTTLDMILQTADLASMLISRSAGRIPKSKEDVYIILQREAMTGRLSQKTVTALLENYDEIWKRVKQESDKILVTYRKLQIQFEKVSAKLQELQK